MQLLEVYTPGLDAYVKYKVLDPMDVDVFIDANRHLEKDEYAKNVMDLVVYNLRTDVVDALRKIDKDHARMIMDSVYNGCIMLNPGLDVDAWLKITVMPIDSEKSVEKPPAAAITAAKPKKKSTTKTKKSTRITRAKFKALEPYLKNAVIGQDEAIDTIVAALKRSIVGLADVNRPLGVFLFAGASGVGKTHVAKELHKYLFGNAHEIVRIDCGEFQHKHENQKLLGAPPGYVGYDEGGQLTSKVTENPNTVILLDEVEKAHPDIWNTFLRIFDEGMTTDGRGNEVSFRDSIIIMTTNLGNDRTFKDSLDIGVGFNRNSGVDISNSVAPTRDKVVANTDKAIVDYFKPEFINRIDKTIVFNHLSNETMIGIAALEMDHISDKLHKRGITINYGDDVLSQMVDLGVNAVEGARGLSRVRRDNVEDVVADALLAHSRIPRGTNVTIHVEDGNFVAEIIKPKRNKKEETTT